MQAQGKKQQNSSDCAFRGVKTITYLTPIDLLPSFDKMTEDANKAAEHALTMGIK